MKLSRQKLEQYVSSSNHLKRNLEKVQNKKTKLFVKQLQQGKQLLHKLDN